MTLFSHKENVIKVCDNPWGVEGRQKKGYKKILPKRFFDIMAKMVKEIIMKYASWCFDYYAKLSINSIKKSI